VIRNSTFHGNSAGDGGAAFPGDEGGDGGSGGAVAVTSTGGLLITQSTIAGNTAGEPGADADAGDGGGVAAVFPAPSIGVTGSIIANNVASADDGFMTEPDGHNCNDVTDLGDNISFGADRANDGCESAGFTFADPGLTAGPPANNGGPTNTIAISPTGAAANAIDPASGDCAATDQRGVARPQGGACEVGAFEVEAPACSDLSVNTTAGAPVAVALQCAGDGSLTYAIADAPLSGSASGLNPATGTLTYTPDSGFTGFDSFTYTATGPGGAAEEATVSVFVGPEPSNIFRIVSVKPNAKQGTATITLEVPGPGELKLSGKGLKKASKQADARGKVKLTAKPTGKLAKKLKKRGKAAAKAKLAYTPEAGEPSRQSATVRFKRKR
jgi:hypothetical protein